VALRAILAPECFLVSHLSDARSDRHLASPRSTATRLHSRNHDTAKTNSGRKLPAQIAYFVERIAAARCD